jgi:DNA-binding GntR family transcriptional regulator
MRTTPTGARRRGKAGAETGAAATAAAYCRLHSLIVDSVLAPGSPLVESDLCKRLGVSRTPVRAALLRLQQEGLVRGTPGRSGRTIVSPLTAADLREIFLMVGALEATAARRAAGLEAAARAALATTLEAANAGLRAAFARRPPDLAAALAEHARFHRAAIEVAAGPRLRAEIAALGPQADRYHRGYSAATISAIEPMTAGHDAIIAAVRAGDGDAAEHAVAADWRLAADCHAELVAVLGERGNW